MKSVTERLIEHEGLRLKPYKCPAGYLTIGIGRNLETKGITEEEATLLLMNDIDECIQDLQKIFLRWMEFSETRHVALIDIRFQHGPQGFRLYKKMIEAIQTDNWLRASNELLDSLYAQRFPKRAQENAELLRNGSGELVI